ncbi:MAG TPA: LON peptidase substrate-binding domain-containing protein [Gammaproteobacteria bacterium]|nr:LON peptidase substrate-binding domain-containing protein [Gammaproteobacteria bacterium]
MRIPLFPLNSVLFPGGILTLRIFEQRYLRMISDCLTNEAPFGICLIRKGVEVGDAATPFKVGTLARIVDWNQRADGLLGITVQGERRFAIVAQEADPDQLLYAQVNLLEEMPAAPLTEDFQPLAELLRRIFDQLDDSDKPKGQHPNDAAWVGCRLAELLPLPLRHKQRLLETDDPIERLQLLHRMLQPDTAS